MEVRTERYLRVRVLKFLKLSKEFGLHSLSTENTMEDFEKGGGFFSVGWDQRWEKMGVWSLSQ